MTDKEKQAELLRKYGLDFANSNISDIERASIKHQLVRSGRDWEELYGNPEEGKE